MKTSLLILFFAAAIVWARTLTFEYDLPAQLTPDCRFGIWWGTDLAALTNFTLSDGITNEIVVTNLPPATIYALARTMSLAGISGPSNLVTNGVVPEPVNWKLIILTSGGVGGPWTELTNLVVAITNPPPTQRFFRLKISQ